MKKLVFLAGALIVTALSAAVFFTDKPLTEQEKLILRNVEAIAQHESVGGNGLCEQVHYVIETLGGCDNYKPTRTVDVYICYWGYREILEMCWAGTITKSLLCDGTPYDIDVSGGSSPLLTTCIENI